MLSASTNQLEPGTPVRFIKGHLDELRQLQLLLQQTKRGRRDVAVAIEQDAFERKRVRALRDQILNTQNEHDKGFNSKLVQYAVECTKRAPAPTSPMPLLPATSETQLETMAVPVLLLRVRNLSWLL